METLDEFIVSVSAWAGREEAAIVERRIRLLLQPKPKSRPEWFHRRMITRLLMVEVNL